VIKSGRARGHQRWKCKSCAHQFTRTTPKGKPYTLKVLALLLYLLGLPMSRIAWLCQVSTVAVYKWIKALLAQLPEAGLHPVGAGEIVVLDELWHYVGSKKTSIGPGKPFVLPLAPSWALSAGLVLPPA
jgi:transposase